MLHQKRPFYKCCQILCILFTRIKLYITIDSIFQKISLVCLFKCLSTLVGYLMPNLSLKNKCSGTIYSGIEEKRNSYLSKRYLSKMNAIARLEFELALYNVEVKHVSHYSHKTSQILFKRSNNVGSVKLLFTFLTCIKMPTTSKTKEQISQSRSKSRKRLCILLLSYLRLDLHIVKLRKHLKSLGSRPKNRPLISKGN